MALKPFHLLFSIFLLFLAFSAVENNAKGEDIVSDNLSVFNFLTKLLGFQNGGTSPDILQLRNYLKEFGYLDPTLPNSDRFDEALESAVKTYQKNFRVVPSGVLDQATISQMIKPRCGVADIINGTNYMQRNIPGTLPNSGSTFFHIVSHYSFFPGNPKWNKRALTYKFLPGFPTAYMPPVNRAFQSWATASNGYFSFTLVGPNQAADLTVGFYRRAHGDSAPFDGPGGTLAHAYAPQDGRFHYDADEQWSIGAAPNSIDLETVAKHEIGHLLGLGHSNVQQAIMFPSIAPGTTNNIQTDDKNGLRALYGY